MAYQCIQVPAEELWHDLPKHSLPKPTLMKLPTDFVIRRNVLALPETAASGATAMRQRMCFTPDRMLALISCTQTSTIVHAADAQLCHGC